MDIVKLKNGTQEHPAAIQVTMIALQILFETEPIRFYEVACLAKDPKHVIFGGKTSMKTAIELGLVSELGDTFSMPIIVRNVILSAVEGEGFDMTLKRPEEKTGETTPGK